MNNERRKTEVSIWKDFSGLSEQEKITILFRLLRAQVLIGEVVRGKSYAENIRDIFDILCEEAREFKNQGKVGALIPSCDTIDTIASVLAAFPDWEPDERTMQCFAIRLGCEAHEVFPKIVEYLSEERQLRFRLWRESKQE